MNFFFNVLFINHFIKKGDYHSESAEVQRSYDVDSLPATAWRERLKTERKVFLKLPNC